MIQQYTIRIRKVMQNRHKHAAIYLFSLLKAYTKIIQRKKEFEKSMSEE